MTVKELIEHLQKCDPQAEVFVETCNRTDSYDSPLVSGRKPKGIAEVWLCGEDGYAMVCRGTNGWDVLFEVPQ